LMWQGAKCWGLDRWCSNKPPLGAPLVIQLWRRNWA
jgi:hypothetical protein